MLLEPRFRKVSPARASYDMWWDFWPRGGVWWISEELRIVSLSLGDGRPPRPCQLVEKCLHHDQHQTSQGVPGLRPICGLLSPTYHGIPWTLCCTASPGNTDHDTNVGKIRMKL